MNRLLLLTVLAGCLLSDVPAVHAQSMGGGKIRSFLESLNQGDVAGALSLTAPTFIVTLANGASATGAAAAPVLASLPTPITIVSLTSANMAGHGTLRFGSGAPVAVDFTGNLGAIASMTVTDAPGQTQVTPPPWMPLSISASYEAGWNLSAVPPGTSLTATQGPLYTLQPGDTSYETIAAGAATTGGFGYWVYFRRTATMALAAGSDGPYSVRAPAGQYLMVGDPSGTLPAQVSGADIVYTYDPVTGYQQAPRLTPGKGALALSSGGGTITVAPGAEVPTAPPAVAPAP